MNLSEARLLSSAISESMGNIAEAADQALADVKTQADQGITAELIERVLGELTDAFMARERRNLQPLHERLAALETAEAVRVAVGK